MGYVAFRITPEIINELIAAGHLVIDNDYYAEPEHADTPRCAMPSDAKLFTWSFNGEIAPLGEMTVVLEHELLWRVAPGAEFPHVAIKVNK